MLRDVTRLQPRPTKKNSPKTRAEPSHFQRPGKLTLAL
jgi:hypothetical protein